MRPLYRSWPHLGGKSTSNKTVTLPWDTALLSSPNDLENLFLAMVVRIAFLASEHLRTSCKPWIRARKQNATFRSDNFTGKNCDNQNKNNINPKQSYNLLSRPSGCFTAWHNHTEKLYAWDPRSQANHLELVATIRRWTGGICGQLRLAAELFKGAWWLFRDFPFSNNVLYIAYRGTTRIMIQYSAL